MNLTRTYAAVLLAALAGTAAVFAGHSKVQAQAQSASPPTTPGPPTMQAAPPAVRPQAASAPARAMIFLDPAHGGPETGASLGNNVTEKDVVLAFAQRLRPALASAGLAVIATRDSDLSAPLLTDERAEDANRVHALACIVIHATASGFGVHLFTSTLLPASTSDDAENDAILPYTPLAWESAQAGYVYQSRRLSDLFKATLAKTGLPVLTGAAPLRPLDNMMCPAVAIEIAPAGSGGNATSAADTAYQQQIAAAIVSALQLWRDQNTPRPGDAP